MRTVAQRKRENWEQQQAGDSKGKGKARDPPLDPAQIPLFPWSEQPLLTAQQRTRALDRSASTSKLPIHPAPAPGTGPPVLIRPYTPASSTWETLRAPVHASSSPSPSKGPLATLYAAAHNMRGSRDLSSQLFIALLRAIDVPARLVVSLQAAEWRSKAQSGGGSRAKGRGKSGQSASARGSGKGLRGKLAAKGKGKTKAEDAEFDFDDEDDSGLEDQVVSARFRPPKPKVKSATSATRKRPAGSASASASASSSRAASADILVLSSTASSASDSDGFVDGYGKLNYKVPKIKLRGSGGAKGKSGQRLAGWKKEAELTRAPSPGSFALSLSILLFRFALPSEERMIDRWLAPI